MNDDRNITDAKIIEKIEKESVRTGPEKLDEVILKEKKIEDKSKKLNLDIFQKLFNQIKLALEMVKDFKSRTYTGVPWRTMALIIVALLYFLNPLDLIPDLLPVIGLTDDAIAFASIFKSLQTDLRNYCLWKGYNTELYF